MEWTIRNLDLSLNRFNCRACNFWKIILLPFCSHLENFPWDRTRPSNRIGNFTSQLPTMFWILKSLNFAWKTKNCQEYIHDHGLLVIKIKHSSTNTVCLHEELSEGYLPLAIITYLFMKLEILYLIYKILGWNKCILQQGFLLWRTSASLDVKCLWNTYFSSSCVPEC